MYEHQSKLASGRKYSAETTFNLWNDVHICVNMYYLVCHVFDLIIIKCLSVCLSQVIKNCIIRSNAVKMLLIVVEIVFFILLMLLSEQRRR